MRILAIETSCDETSVAVVENGTTVLSCVTASSMDLHAQTGGIIPENAARKQVEYIIPTLEAALTKAFPKVNAHEALAEHIDAIAVTAGPGLIGSLLVGVETAKTLTAVFNKPLIPVNHIKAHIYGAFLSDPAPQFPFVALIVSGGHTDFIYMKDHDDYDWIGGTRDDAAGECFDKCARILNLEVPRGSAVAASADKFISEHPDARLQLFPRPMIHDDNFDMSFSGLKTAVSRLVKENEKDNLYSNEQLAAELQEAIVATLVNKSGKAINAYSSASFVCCGGVSANARLRNALLALQKNELQNLSIHVPDIRYTTDNAAMIGSCAFFNPHYISYKDVAPDPELHFK